MIKLVTLIATVAGLVLRFLPGGLIARIALGLVSHWRAALLVVAVIGIFGLGARVGYLGGYTRGVNAGFDQGVAHHERQVAEENAKRAALAVEAEKAVEAETLAARKAEPTIRAAKRRLCNVDANCRDRLRKPRKTRKLVPKRQLADDQGSESGERAPVGLLR